MKRILTILFLLISTFSFAQMGIVNYDTIQAKSIQADSALWIRYLENGGTDTLLTIDNGKVKYSVDFATQSWVLSQIPDSIGGSSNLHVEAGRLENLSSHLISVVFSENFINQPIGEEPQIYRIENFKGKFRRENLLWGWEDANQPTTTGFSLNIDNSEPLTNVILEYAYVEIIKDWILENGIWNDNNYWIDNKVWID
jgi:hypothetical protein